jgi:hypothetical protein
MDLTNNALRDALHQVERDEAEAIRVLCSVLENVEKSRSFDCLLAVREVLKEWQNCPPGVIVTSLMKIEEQLEGACNRPDCA